MSDPQTILARELRPGDVVHFGIKEFAATVKYVVPSASEKFLVRFEEFEAANNFFGDVKFDLVSRGESC